MEIYVLSHWTVGYFIDGDLGDLPKIQVMEDN